jgi:predicted ATPase
MKKLIVNGFGPINNLDLEVKDYMVFVGPQASGKSTVSKLLYFFDELWKEIVYPKDEVFRLFASGKADKIDFAQFEIYLKNWISLTFVNVFGALANVSDNESTVKFEYDAKKSVLLKFSDKVEVLFSEELSKEIPNRAKILVTAVSVYGLSSSDSRIFLESLFKDEVSVVPSGSDKDILFIPTGRSIATTIANQLHNLEFKNVDHLTRSFVKRIINERLYFNKGVKGFIETYKKGNSVRSDFNINLAQKFIGDIVKGEYIFEFENEKIQLDNGRSIALNYASSGQQEALWIVLFCLDFMINNKNVDLYIEEPEAHLYPESQKNIMDLIAMFFNSANNQVVITTHSPYILGSINNLLYAHRVGQKYPEQVSKYINKEIWLDYQRIGAYLVQNGTITNIMDSELNLIQNEVIDGIARQINEDFDALFELENN